MTFDERRFSKHQHRYFVDSESRDEVCMCGDVKGKTKRPKYGNKRTEFRGSMYDSQFEAEVAYDFEMMRRAGKIKTVERQVNLDLRVYGDHIAFYKADFRITWADGSQEIVEAKGAWAKESWLKWKLFEIIWSHEHPEVKLTVIRQESTYKRFKRT